MIKEIEEREEEDPWEKFYSLKHRLAVYKNSLEEGVLDNEINKHFSAGVLSTLTVIKTLLEKNPTILENYIWDQFQQILKLYEESKR